MALARATTEKRWCPVSIKGIKQEPLAVTPYNEKGKPPPIDAYMVIDSGKPKLFLRGYSQDGKLKKSVWSETRMPSAIVGVVFPG